MPCAEYLPGTFTPRSASLWRRIGCAFQNAWRAYWRRRTERATLFMLQSLDDRTLKDIGIDRSEIGSVVYCGQGRRRATRYTRHPGRSDASHRRQRSEPGPREGRLVDGGPG
jgi:uncharacterized protein YjiS (DUF1127 family)